MVKITAPVQDSVCGGHINPHGEDFTASTDGFSPESPAAETRDDKPASSNKHRPRIETGNFKMLKKISALGESAGRIMNKLEGEWTFLDIRAR